MDRKGEGSKGGKEKGGGSRREIMRTGHPHGGWEGQGDGLDNRVRRRRMKMTAQ